MDEFVLGDYIFSRKKIGKGAFSVIYKGTHRVTKKIFAIKEISYENLSKIKHTIKREFTVMKKLNHPNIIKLHEVFFDNDNKNVYLVLDYYEKGDLCNFLDGKPLKEKYAKKYMRQLASGLKYLHENNIIHRDLKLKNILVTNSNDIVISDFGFARDGDSNTMFDTLCGSPMYMAPEIMNHKVYDNKSDLWSVGVIMYELLFGTTPYHAKNMIELMKKIKRRDIVIPNEYHDLVSENCIDLLFSLLNKNPKKRITWIAFFEHVWFKTDEILENENKLMDINMTNSVSNSLSKYSLRTSTQFLNSKAFKHNSIRNKTSDEESYESTNTQFHLSIENNKSLEHSSKSEYHDIPLQSHIEEDNSDSESDNDSDQEESVYFDSYQDITKVVSEPIDINHDKSNNDNVSMFYSNKNDYHLIKSVDYKYMSEPAIQESPNSLSNSFKNYLFNSIDFLKHSYYYISRKTI
jgi:serine/threonine-protein kinase ULK2